MPIVWPVTVPASPLYDGYSEAMPNYTLRSSMDSGPSKVRRKCSALPWLMTVNFVLSASQLSALVTFVETTLIGGTLRFEFTHPRTGSTVECRVAGSDSLMQIAPRGQSSSWSVALTLEVLP
jgi:hypothetical protein